MVFVIMVMWILLFNGYDVILMFVGISWVIICIVVYLFLVVLGLDFVLIVLMFGNWVYVNEKKWNLGGYFFISSIVGGVVCLFEGGECDVYMYWIDLYVLCDVW